MGNKSESAISRREFARRAAFASAAASLAPASLLNTESPNTPRPTQQPSNAPKLTPEGQAEVEARVQSIFALYGSRFSEAQKADIRRLATEAQRALERLRAFPVDNGAGTGLYLKPLM